MRLAAYIMLSDAEWLPASVGSYYDAVERILVSYDRDGLGWTGLPLDTQAALESVRGLDRAGKCRYLAGRYADPGRPPIENDTRQRQEALDALAADGPDWILQVDTDEVIPDVGPMDRLAAAADAAGAAAAEWPMRTFFQRLADGRYLEIRGARGQPDYGYPGPVLVRPGARLTLARRCEEPTLRPVVRGDRTSPSVHPSGVASNVRLVEMLAPEEAMWHFSWVRSDEGMRAKLATWGHSGDFDAERFHRRVWTAAPMRWRRLRNFHPICGPWWPRLAPAALPVGPSCREERPSER